MKVFTIYLPLFSLACAAIGMLASGAEFVGGPTVGKWVSVVVVVGSIINLLLFIPVLCWAESIAKKGQI